MLEEWEQILKEAYKSIEQEISGDDKGWVNLTALSKDTTFTTAQKIDIIKRSRFYAKIDPLATQALRLWTDYTFGGGLSWRCEDEKIKNILNLSWKAKNNKTILSTKGQRKSSYKLLTDGSVYLALFLAPKGLVTIRRIDPLEITETITNPDDSEDI
ncbi:MAG: hypothetical protein Q8M94_07270, partial [Ignavibacteria bacterium]|nr:hypothetical protein [Ignavibacteria bacterium]